MVRAAFERLSGLQTRLICFSDDLDGLRKVPGNVPNREMLREDLGRPLSSVRDPFGSHRSFAEHNNAMLRGFLDGFGFEYEFLSSTECYRSGRFDNMLIRVLERFDKVMNIMLPSLGVVEEGRRESYSPFLPISQKTGRVLQVPTLERRPEKGTIIYREPDGELVETPVTGGAVKLQWKPDWAMRWAALGVDYEMYGKDLIPSAILARKICRALGCQSPVELSYELFLDADGQKISKSRGNGISFEEWLEYATPESLSYFMYQKPKTAKRLFFEIIPRTVDEYHQQLQAFETQDLARRLSNPVWHIHDGSPPASNLVVPYNTLLNLASVVSTDSPEVLWGFIRRYEPGVTPAGNPELDVAVKQALAYCRDRVAPTRTFRMPDKQEQQALDDLAQRLRAWEGPAEPEALQSMTFSVGRDHAFEPLRKWFKALYEILLGASQGPRIGGFIALYGVNETAALIESRIDPAA